MEKPELLSPAGSLKSLRYALAFGADAVYAGLPRYSLRVRNNEFTRDNLEAAIRETHGQGKKFYLTCNLLPHGAKLRTFIADIEPMVALGPDALIMADPGLIMLVRERWPQMAVHLSVQANTLNAAAVRFWKQAGVGRVILSRELSLGEIGEIRRECPEIELEVFVHGALCVAYSGRCLLSGYFNHRDANQGACTNSCRWGYRLLEAQDDEGGDLFPEVDRRHPEADRDYLLEESERPGELMPVFEDEHGTYIMNSRDLRAVEHVARLVEMGVDSMKIEGRTKSHYYAARTAQVYRWAIDDAVAGRAFNPGLLGELENLANRGYTDGFYQRHPSQEYQNYLQGASESRKQRFVGEVIGRDRLTGLADIEVKNSFSVGNTLELMTPSGNRTFRLERMQDMEGATVSTAPGSGYFVRIRLPVDNVELGLLARNLD
ncbi:MAG: tRNA 5-hydroxyuridine modification protein YegQ [Gammaproteobacteria bacterium]|nr:tRNA 5-hydroxyuridine modification protein YegQ [Gammaproteobacteria bacterium]